MFPPPNLCVSTGVTILCTSTGVTIRARAQASPLTHPPYAIMTPALNPLTLTRPEDRDERT